MLTPPDLSLPDGAHLLHIGPQKTGTTAIQAALHASREELREHGVVYPGPKSRPREAAEVGLGFGRIKLRGSMDAWHDLLRQVHDPERRLTCVSLEAFGRATDEQAERVVAELGGDQPYVLAVARAYDRLLPSQWQQRVKSQLRLTYDDWLRIVLGDRPSEELDLQHWTNVWVPHDTVGLVDRWARVVGPDRVILVVRREHERDQLHVLFEQLLGLPAGFLPRDAGRDNPSLSAPRTELVRALNEIFHESGWIGSDAHERLRRAAVRALVQAPPDPEEPRLPTVPEWAWGRLVELSDARIAGLAQWPGRVVGDLEDLRVTRPDPDTVPHSGAVSTDAAAAAMAAMVALAEGRRVSS